MERFAFKIDSPLRSKLYQLCRLCGIDNPKKERIFKLNKDEDSDDEPDLCNKIRECVGIKCARSDQMPQSVCMLCADRVNDMYEYRLMCSNTQRQTRKLLGLPEAQPKKTKAKLKSSDGQSDNKNVITPIAVASAKKTPTNAQKQMPMVTIAMPSTSSSHSNYSSSSSKPTTTTTKTRTDSSHIPYNGDDDEDDDDGNLLVPLLSMKPQSLPKQTQKARKRVADALPPSVGLQSMKVPKIEPSFADFGRGEAPTVWCRICRGGHADNAGLEQHLRIAHVPCVFRYGCIGCTMTFSTLVEQKEHHAWHINTNSTYKCPLCDKVIAKLSGFPYHMTMCKQQGSARAAANAAGGRASSSSVALVGEFNCTQCGATFVTRNLYDWHACFMRPNGACPRCGKRFVRKQMLFRHAVKCDGKFAPAAPPAASAALAATPTIDKSRNSSPASLTAPKKTLTKPQKSSKQNVAAVKMEPETMLDIDDNAMDNDRDGGDDIGGTGHHGDDDSYSDNDDFNSTENDSGNVPELCKRMRIKLEPLTILSNGNDDSNSAVQNKQNDDDDDDDDVILIENAANRPTIVINDELPSPQKNQQPPAIRIKLEPPAQTIQPSTIKQEPRDEAIADDTDICDGYAAETEAAAIAANRLSVKQEHSNNAIQRTGTVPLPIKLERDIQRTAAVSDTTKTTVRIKCEPADRPDEAEADDSDVYDGYADDNNSSESTTTTPATVLFRIKREPGTQPIVSKPSPKPPQSVTAAPFAGGRPVKIEPGLLRLKISKQDGTLNARLLADADEQAAQTNSSEPPSAASSLKSKLHARLMEKIRLEVQERKRRQTAEIVRIKTERMSPSRETNDEATGSDAIDADAAADSPNSCATDDRTSVSDADDAPATELSKSGNPCADQQDKVDGNLSKNVAAIDSTITEGDVHDSISATVESLVPNDANSATTAAFTAEMQTNELSDVSNVFSAEIDAAISPETLQAIDKVCQSLDKAIVSESLQSSLPPQLQSVDPIPCTSSAEIAAVSETKINSEITRTAAESQSLHESQQQLQSAEKSVEPIASAVSSDIEPVPEQVETTVLAAHVNSETPAHVNAEQMTAVLPDVHISGPEDIIDSAVRDTAIANLPLIDDGAVVGPEPTTN